VGKVSDSISEELREWIEAQRIFFVATAPRADEGLVNCSPKGMDSFRVFDPQTVGYLDLTGSGIETVAHLRENGRIVILFCAFAGPPRILRLHGRGDVVVPGAAEWDLLAARFPALPGARSIVRVRVTRVAASCGYGVPRFDHREDRDALTKWAVAKGDEGVARYQDVNNRKSLDGLPGL
jgi:Pyridoxamine 5'-phosphate oxidase